MNYIAVYWFPTDIKQGNGKIHYLMIDSSDGRFKSNEEEIKMLIGEINKATNAGLFLMNITSLLYITWNKMQPTPPIVSIIVIISSFVVIEMNLRTDQSY